MCGLRVTWNVHLTLGDPRTSSSHGVWSLATFWPHLDLGKPGSSGTLSHHPTQYYCHKRSQRRELLPKENFFKKVIFYAGVTA